LASANISPGDVEAVTVDPDEDGIGPAINADHRFAIVPWLTKTRGQVL
jgi:hypothetical protein